MSISTLPHARRRRWRLALDILAFLAVLSGLGWLIVEGAGALHYNWQWHRIPPYLYRIEDSTFYPGPLLRGLGVTLELTGWSLLLTVILVPLMVFVALPAIHKNFTNWIRK